MILAALSLIASAADIPFPAPDGPHYDLEVLYHERHFQDGLKLVKEQIVATPDDHELYWHQVRFMFQIAEAVPKTDATFDKLAWYTEMVEIANLGLTKKPGDPHLLFGLGLGHGRYGTTKGVLSSLFLADDVEDAWLTAANSGYLYRSIGDEEMMPCDVQNGLGIFYRLVPDSWVVDKIAGTRGSLTKSVEWLKKADQCGPNRISVLKEYGVAQICYGQKNKDEGSIGAGISTLARAAGLPVKGINDRIDLQHIATLIADPDLACGYSRDGQQDLDEKKLEKQGE